MEQIKELLQTLTVSEIQELIAAIQQWYKTEYPDWDVVYMAVPKEPNQRREALEGIWKMLQRDLDWNEKRYGERG